MTISLWFYWPVRRRAFAALRLLFKPGSVRLLDMQRTVLLLRHAMPEVRPEECPSRWPLTTTGHIAARDLANHLPQDAALASSPEVKAIQTLRAAVGVTCQAIHLDARFSEVSRPDEPFDDDFKCRRLAWVTGHLDERHDTWESPDDAAARFQAGLDGMDAETVVVASHGMVITAWLAGIGYVQPGKPAGELWLGLRFPELLTVHLDEER